jgi:hypothetical protein
MTYWELAGYLRFVFGTFKLFDEFWQSHRDGGSSLDNESGRDREMGERIGMGDEEKFGKLDGILQNLVDEEIARLATYLRDFMLVSRTLFGD